jgi:hypothetical protein
LAWLFGKFGAQVKNRSKEVKRALLILMHETEHHRRFEQGEYQSDRYGSRKITPTNAHLAAHATLAASSNEAVDVMALLLSLGCHWSDNEELSRRIEIVRR